MNEIMTFPTFLATLTADKENPNNITIAFTMALNAQKKGHRAAVLLLSDAVKLVQKGYSDDIDIGEPFKPIKPLINEFQAAGGTIKVCSACMIHNNISTDDELLEGIEIVNAEDVIDLLDNAKTTLQLN
ncbi:DsrE family protein [Numidum massiliense]|uniref:DsrE family protein n=1 Tax=Numidum massiliense TaxID=1522315 RepID=UPI001C9CFD44|nr:DsrE family protein [Numidum massiliense]